MEDVFNLDKKNFRITFIEGHHTEVNESTEFHFHQKDTTVWATYRGGKVIIGQLVGVLDGKNLDHAYIQVNYAGEINSGRGRSKLERNPSGKIEIIEEWQWENREGSGKSIMTEQ